MSSHNPLEALSFRDIFSVLRGNDGRRVIPMLFMLFFICFNYSLLRNLKDALSITAASAAVIPVLKVWGVLPFAIIITVIFTKLSHRYSQETVFYIITSGFLSFYAVFAFVIYPKRELLYLYSFSNFLYEWLPTSFDGFISMILYWPLSSFYIVSELWSSMVMSVLFFGFANEITKVSQARLYYSVLGIGSNLAAIIAGELGAYLSAIDYFPLLPFGHTGWDQGFIIMLILVILCGLATLGAFRWMNVYVLNDSQYDGLHKGSAIKVKKRLSIRESLKHLRASNYLLCIAALVVSYNLVINLVEVVWKEQLKMLYPSPEEFYSYLSHQTSVVGIVSTMTAIFMPKILKYLGWTGTALLTPIVMLITCAGFFIFLFTNDVGSSMSIIGFSPLAIAVFFGGMQNCLSKAAKYSVFDTTKEIAFIPLEHETKLRGKAAIDGVGSRFGKSGGAVIHISLLMLLSSIGATAPYIAAIILVAIGLWIVAVKSLGKQFTALISKKGEKLDAEPDQDNGQDNGDTSSKLQSLEVISE